MGFGREKDKSRVGVLRSDLVISELLYEFRPSYHVVEPDVFLLRSHFGLSANEFRTVKARIVLVFRGI